MMTILPPTHPDRRGPLSDLTGAAPGESCLMLKRPCAEAGMQSLSPSSQSDGSHLKARTAPPAPFSPASFSVRCVRKMRGWEAFSPIHLHPLGGLGAAAIARASVVPGTLQPAPPGAHRQQATPQLLPPFGAILHIAWQVFDIVRPGEKLWGVRLPFRYPLKDETL